MQRQSLFGGCLCILFARNPEILSGIQVGKRMKWWIIPKGNLMEIAATDGGMYRRAIKNFAGAFKNT
jgi:hypothetical protein